METTYLKLSNGTEFMTKKLKYKNGVRNDDVSGFAYVDGNLIQDVYLMFQRQYDKEFQDLINRKKQKRKKVWKY